METALPLAHVGHGTFAPLQLAPLLIVALAYAMRARTLAARDRPVPMIKQLSFSAGVVLVLAALVSPGAHLGSELVLAHMTQHLVMADIATLLIVLGLTGPVLAPVLRLRAVDRLRVLAHPPVALPLWMADLYLWHLPFAYQGALHHEAVHAAQHACFVGFGIAMWMGLLGPLPKPAWFGNAARLGYVIGVRLAGILLANAFIWSGSVFYPDYAKGEHYWGITPLADQGAAGNIMAIEGSLVTLGLFAWLFLKAARESEERQDLLDLADRRGVALDAARAGRAAAAGRTAELQERLLAGGGDAGGA